MPKPVWPPPTLLPGPILPRNLHNIPTGLRSQPSTRYITEWSGEKGGMPFPYFPFSISYLSTGSTHCFCNSRKIEGSSLFLSRITCHQRLNGLSSVSCFFEEGPGCHSAGQATTSVPCPEGALPAVRTITKQSEPFGAWGRAEKCLKLMAVSFLYSQRPRSVDTTAAPPGSLEFPPKTMEMSHGCQSNCWEKSKANKAQINSDFQPSSAHGQSLSCVHRTPLQDTLPANSGLTSECPPAQLAWDHPVSINRHVWLLKFPSLSALIWTTCQTFTHGQTQKNHTVGDIHKATLSVPSVVLTLSPTGRIVLDNSDRTKPGDL